MTAKKAATKTTAAKKVRKPRPSRSKAAVAARAAAKAALPTDVATQVADDTREVFLQSETDLAVAALEVDDEVVRALADADGPDPFAGKSAADQFAEGVSDSTWDFMADVDERAAAALGVTPEMQHQTLLAYYDRVRELEAENASLESRLEELEASTERNLNTLRQQKETAIDERNAARRRVTELDGMLKTWMEEHDRLYKQHEATSAQLIELGADLDASEERIDYLEAELAHARRPWIAKLLGRA